MSAAPVYMPTHGSLEERVVEWLRKNPDEELQRSDVASKFQVAQTAVAPALAWAVARGELAWMKPDDGVAGVYRLGTGTTIEVPPLRPAAASAPALGTKPQASVSSPTDISVQVSRDGHLCVSFLLPRHAEPRLVAAAMLTAAARAIERVEVAQP